MKIRNFAKIEHITAFELNKRAGEHSRLKFSASIVEDAAEICLSYLGKTISVATDDSTPIFFGRIESVEVEDMLGAHRVNVSCVSLSILADENPRTRIFHNPAKKIADVLSNTHLALESCGLKVSSDFANLKYPPVVLQNQETNFEFIARIAGNFGRRLWIIDTRQPADFLIDSCVEKSALKIPRSQITTIRRSRNSLSIATKNFMTLGQVVTVEGDTTEFVIAGMNIRYERAMYIFNYELVEHKIDTPKIPAAPVLAKTVKLHARVKNTADPENLGRIQVDFDDKFLEDMDAADALWIPYLTPYGGIVFIPDVGATVEVIFANEDVYCAAVLRETALAEECRKVAEKFICNNHGQKIVWRENSLELHSGNYRIVMNDSGVELVAGENSIAVTENGVVVKAKSATVNASGTLKLAGANIELC